MYCMFLHINLVLVLQGDYRQLVHELDQYQYSELRLVVLDIRNTYVRHLLPVVHFHFYMQFYIKLLTDYDCIYTACTLFEY